MDKICQNCKTSFTIEEIDQEFYTKFDVPEPTWCPECRMIRRLVWRGERNLYKRNCDLCNESKILMYPQDSDYTVYCRDCWISDKWDPLSYGKEYDFNKPFFEQWHELFKTVPRVGIVKQGNLVNAEYTNRVTDMKNCYLVFGTTVAEDCKYSRGVLDSKQCLDCYDVMQSEKCYFSTDCYKCYNVRFSQESVECTDSMFLFNCRNVSNSFGCVNLRNAQYCIFNKQYTKEEYDKAMQSMATDSSMYLEGMKAKFKDFKKQFIVPALMTNRSEASTGNWLTNCKNVTKSFSAADAEDCRYVAFMIRAKDSMDHTHWSNGSEKIYECSSVGIQCSNVKFTVESWSQLMDAQYCANCQQSQYLFGCSGVRNKQYCILNKQYTKEEYEDMLPKIRQHMNDMPYTDNKGREYRYGEFYPPTFSPFAYNETLAQEYFPLTQTQATEQGYRWKESEQRSYTITMPAQNVPDTIENTPDTISNEVIGCQHQAQCNDQCTTAFKITPDELQFYKAMNIPVPQLCSNCRYYERLAWRNPLKLWPRSCMCAGARSENGLYTNVSANHKPHAQDRSCPNTFETTYSPDRQEQVYCIECYNSEIV